MSKYILKATVPDRIFDIRLSGAKIGCVRKKDDGNFIAFTTGTGPMQRATAATANEAFTELVTILNRISLCGENDAMKAREALAKRNARVEKQNAQDRKDMEPIVEAFEKVLGVRLPQRRPRYTKIRI